jgi:hypothetical protein
MTEYLYHIDSYLREFDAGVLFSDAVNRFVIWTGQLFTRAEEGSFVTSAPYL